MISFVEQYQNLKKIIPELLEFAGYRNYFIAKKIGMDPKYFSVKKQRGNWSDEEVKKSFRL